MTDLGAALQWNFGSLAPGETTDRLGVGFAAGISRPDIEALLGDFTVDLFSDPITLPDGRESEEDAFGGETGDDTAAANPFPVSGLFDANIGPPVDCDDDGLYEDVNGDGRVTVADFFALRRILRAHQASSRGEEPLLTEEQAMAFDFDGDGNFDRADLFVFLQGVRTGRIGCS